MDKPIKQALQPNETIFFVTPTLRKGTLQYLESYAEDHPAATLLSFRNDEQLLEKLDTSSAWHDAGHLAAPGAQTYTLWLAEELKRSGILTRP